jgi:hypothetical protein
MHRPHLFLLAGCLACAQVPAAEPSAPEWLVITAPAFRAALAPLVEHRRSEGFRVQVVESTNILTPEQIRQTNALPLQAHLAQLCQRRKGPSYLLLVGAVAASNWVAAEQTVVPPLPGTVGRMKGQPSDHAYGCLDTNSAPTVAVGRFPARTVDEVRGMVQKTLAWERDRQPGAWRNRIVLLGGNPGGGPLAEAMVEQVAQSRFHQLHPYWAVQAMFHSSISRYYLPGTLLHDTATRFLAGGEFMALYLGHSSAPGLWSKNTNFLTRDDWAQLKIPRGPGVFFTSGCFACQLGGRDGEGYGLAAMRNPAGPVAVLGAHGESYSAAGLLALDGLLRCFNTPPFPSRLSDHWLAVKAGLAVGEIEDSTFLLFDQFDGSGGKIPLATQRREHLEMWMLLGDPALRMPIVPLEIRLDVTEPVKAGQRILVKGVVPDGLAGAAVGVTLERMIGSAPTDLEKLPASTPENQEARERIAVSNHRRANSFVLASAGARPEGTRFQCPLEVPATLPWTNVVLRAYAATEAAEALGVLTLPVRQ